MQPITELQEQKWRFEMFFYFFGILEAVVLLEACIAYKNGFFWMSQTKYKPGKKVGVFIEHGGMWGDFLIVSPVIASMANVGIGHWTFRGLVVSFAISIGVSIVMLYQWAEASKNLDEPFAQDGCLTVTGYIHGLYMAVSLAVLILFYWFTPLELTTSTFRLTVSVLLMVHIALGILQPDWNTNGIIHKSSWITVIVGCLLVLVSWLH